MVAGKGDHNPSREKKEMTRRNMVGAAVAAPLLIGSGGKVTPGAGIGGSTSPMPLQYAAATLRSVGVGGVLPSLPAIIKTMPAFPHMDRNGDIVWADDACGNGVYLDPSGVF